MSGRVAVVVVGRLPYRTPCTERMPASQTVGPMFMGDKDLQLIISCVIALVVLVSTLCMRRGWSPPFWLNLKTRVDQ